MAKGRKAQQAQTTSLANFLGDRPSSWEAQLTAVAERYNKEFQRAAFDLPPEIEAMPIFRDWASGALGNRIASPFWEVAKPRKGQKCLDVGCGVSFMIYPWREWDAFFYGQDISTVARDLLNTRGSQLNSKLFKGVQLGGAHQLHYEANQFDLVVATGFSCYYPIAYWQEVLTEAKRVLKPEGLFVFDVVNPDAEIAENWAILETYLGAEVFLEPLTQWQQLIKASGAQLMKQQTGELFQLYKMRFI